MYQSANVTVWVSDFERSVRFYRDALGLELRARHGDNWAEVVGPGLTIGLHPARSGAPAPGPYRGLSIGLHVRSLPEAMATLAGRGVAFSGTREDAGARFADLTDPDGTPLYLVELRHG
jgi:catechol 2,3-dioxygenase-like lactoylglutathione lyase family enzyme